MTTIPQKLVYLVDDSPLYLDLLKFSLEELNGITVKGFASGEACLEELHHQPHTVVLDYHLDGRNPNAQKGSGVLKSIKAKNPATKVIMMTGQKNAQTAIRLIQQGADFFLYKSPDSMELLGKLLTH